MKIAYFDCFSGASGDMLLGSLVDAGLPIEQLVDQLHTLPVGGYRLEAAPGKRGPLSGTKVSVVLEEGPKQRRTLSDIEDILSHSTLKPVIVERAIAVFRRLGLAEAKVHGIPVEDVHFHEVGATDAIVDVTGVVLGLDALGVEKVYCSPLPGGSGYVGSSHGMLPLPAPATLALLAEAGAPLCPPPVTKQPLGELVTPTAAALLTTIATFRQPEVTLQRISYGLGTRDHPELPNALRLWLGEEAAPSGAATSGQPTREIQLLETNIDDMNPELYGYVAERLFAAGALDVWQTPIQMKKNRPGTMLSVLARLEQASSLADLLLTETSTLGVRTCRFSRWEAEREVLQFESSLGAAAVKIKRLRGAVVHIAPEYEACRVLAEQHHLPLGEVYRRVEQEAWARQPGELR